MFFFDLCLDIHTNVSAIISVTILSLSVKSNISVKVNDNIQCYVVLVPKANEKAIVAHRHHTTIRVTKMYPIILLIFIKRNCFITFLFGSGLRRRKKYRKINGSGTVISVVYTIIQKSFQLKLVNDSLIDCSLYFFSSSSS